MPVHADTTAVVIQEPASSASRLSNRWPSPCPLRLVTGSNGENRLEATAAIQAET